LVNGKTGESPEADASRTPNAFGLGAGNEDNNEYFLMGWTRLRRRLQRGNQVGQDECG